MEILHFCPSRSYSGLEQYALQMAADQVQRGKSVGFVVSPGSKLEEECHKHGIRPVLFDPYRPFGILRFWPSFARLLKTQDQLKVIHLHSTQELYHIFGPALLNRTLFNHHPKVILQTHIWINHKKRDPLHAMLYKIADEVWCSSEAGRSTLLQNLPLSDDKIRVINYGRDIESMEGNFLSREEARKILGLPANSIIFGSVSRIEASKGVREFLEASLPLLQHNPHIHLAIVGAPSPHDFTAERYEKDLRSRATGLEPEIRDRIKFLGTVKDSYRYLRAFDIYVLPSYQETFSLALLDALLAGLPVIGTRSGGTPDVVREGETGWLCTPHDIESLSTKMRQALAQKQSWSSYGVAAAERVRTDFDQRKIFKQILDAYRV